MDARYDTRDLEEHAAIAAVLEELPADNPARLAGYRHLLEQSGRHFRP